MKISESKLRIWLSLSTPMLLLILAVLFALGGARTWIWLVAGSLAIGFGLFVLLDFGLAVVVDDRGIARSCVLRTQLIEWDRIAKMTTPMRRGMAVVTKDGRHHILIDRKLDSGERDLFSAQARLHGIEFGR